MLKSLCFMKKQKLLKWCLLHVLLKQKTFQSPKGFETKHTCFKQAHLCKYKSLFNGLVTPLSIFTLITGIPLALPCFFSAIFDLFSVLSLEEKFHQHFQQLFCVSIDTGRSLKMGFRLTKISLDSYMLLVKNIVYLCNFSINQTTLKFKVYLKTYCKLLLIYSILMAFYCS